MRRAPIKSFLTLALAFSFLNPAFVAPDLFSTRFVAEDPKAKEPEKIGEEEDASLPSSAGENWLDTFLFPLWSTATRWDEVTLVLGGFYLFHKGMKTWFYDSLAKEGVGNFAKYRGYVGTWKEKLGQHIRQNYEYRVYPAQIERLEATNERLREELRNLRGSGALIKDRNYETEAELHRKIEKNELMISEMVEKVPLLALERALTPILEVEGQLDAQLTELVRSARKVERERRSRMPKLKGLTAEAEKLQELWKATRQPHWFEDFFNSESGRIFADTKEGKAWMHSHKTLMAKAGESEVFLRTAYNAMIDVFNGKVKPKDRLPKMASPNKRFGTATDTFTMIPQRILPAEHTRPWWDVKARWKGDWDVQQESAERVGREDVRLLIKKACDQTLALLKKDELAARGMARLHRVYMKPIAGLALGSASGYGLYRFFTDYEQRKGVSWAESRKQKKRKDRINDEARTALSAQVAEEFTKGANNRLKPFLELVQKHLLKQQSAIMERVYIHLNPTAEIDRTDPTKFVTPFHPKFNVRAFRRNWREQDHLDPVKAFTKRMVDLREDPHAEIDLVEATLRAAVSKAGEGKVSTIDQLIKLIYTEDSAIQKTALNSYITFVYRDAIGPLYQVESNVEVLSGIESDYLKEMSAATIQDLIQRAIDQKAGKAPLIVVPKTVVPTPVVPVPEGSTATSTPSPGITQGAHQPPVAPDPVASLGLPGGG